MKEKINDKIREIEKYLEKLYSIVPETLEEYRGDFKSKLACERCFEMIIGASIDLAFLIIREKNLKIPEDDETSFFILSQNKIISDNLAKKLKEAKGMRNVIAHEYGEIDDSLVFDSIKEELEKDIGEFINLIRLIIK